MNHKLPETTETLQAQIVVLKQQIELQKQELDTLQQQIEGQKQETDLLKNIIALMPGHVYWVGTDGRYRGCNDQQAQSAGLTCRQDIVGKLNKELPWNYCEEKLPDNLDRMNAMVMSLQETLTLEEPAILPDGTQKTFLSTKKPLFNPAGELIGMVGISIDITQRKTSLKTLASACQESAAAHRVQTEFLKTLSQDIREPIDGFLETARLLQSLDVKHRNAQTVVSYIGVELQKSSEELLSLFDALLESAQVASEQIPVRREKFDLPALIERVLLVTGRTAHMKHVGIFPYLDTYIPTIMGDPLRFYRIILELVMQAIRVSEEYCSLRMEVKFGLRTDYTQGIRISMEDTGPNVPEAMRPRLFTGLYTRPAITLPSQPKRQRLELGLLLIKQLVEELKGEIYYEPRYLRDSEARIKPGPNAPETPTMPETPEAPEAQNGSNTPFDNPACDEQEPSSRGPFLGGRIVCILPLEFVANTLEPTPTKTNRRNKKDEPTQMFNSTYWAIARRLNGEPMWT